MTAAVFNFSGENAVEQGATWQFPLRLTILPEGETVRVPVDITGWDFRMQVREKDQDGPIVIELTVGNGLIIIGDPTDGQFAIIVDDVTTDAFVAAQFKQAVYDLEGIEPAPSDVVHRLLEGDVDLNLNITR